MGLEPWRTRSPSTLLEKPARGRAWETGAGGVSLGVQRRAGWAGLWGPMLVSCMVKYVFIEFQAPGDHRDAVQRSPPGAAEPEGGRVPVRGPLEPYSLHHEHTLGLRTQEGSLAFPLDTLERPQLLYPPTGEHPARKSPPSPAVMPPGDRAAFPYAFFMSVLFKAPLPLPIVRQVGGRGWSLSREGRFLSSAAGLLHELTAHLQPLRRLWRGEVQLSPSRPLPCRGAQRQSPPTPQTRSALHTVLGGWWRSRAPSSRKTKPCCPWGAPGRSRESIRQSKGSRGPGCLLPLLPRSP